MTSVLYGTEEGLHRYQAAQRVQKPDLNTRRCQDDHPQCCLIEAGLRQYTTARHVCRQTQPDVHWPRWCVKHGVLSAPRSYAANYTIC